MMLYVPTPAAERRGGGGGGPPRGAPEAVGAFPGSWSRRTAVPPGLLTPRENLGRAWGGVGGGGSEHFGAPPARLASRGASCKLQRATDSRQGCLAGWRCLNLSPPSAGPTAMRWGLRWVGRVAHVGGGWAGSCGWSRASCKGQPGFRGPAQA